MVDGRIVLELLYPVSGLGSTGAIVVCDCSHHPKGGDWVLVEGKSGPSCLRWHEGAPWSATVVHVLDVVQEQC